MIDQNSLDQILDFDFSYLSKNTLFEEDVRLIVVEVKNNSHKLHILQSFLTSEYLINNQYDFNIGELLSNFDATDLAYLVQTLNFEVIKQSAGFVWAIGKLGYKDSNLINFLRKVVESTKNDKAWWNAAHSLEKLSDEQAIPYLKMSLKALSSSNTLQNYLDSLQNKKSVIGVLSLANSANTKEVIYPSIKNIILNSSDQDEIENVLWLIGRFRFFDQEITNKIKFYLYNSNGNILKNVLFCLEQINNPVIKEILLELISNENPKLRKTAVIGLSNQYNFQPVSIFEKMLFSENDTNVIKALTNAIYKLRNPTSKSKFRLISNNQLQENGMISDDNDKWYGSPSIYDVFSNCEDPENICFSLVERLIENKKINNPIDLACGTGRMALQMASRINFDGKIICADASEQMCSFIEKKTVRDSGSCDRFQVVNAKIDQLPEIVGYSSSNFIISSFGFPSRIFNFSQVKKDLEAVNNILSEDGLFVTIGWDETFNDELSEMWYRFVPDSITASSFEDWRKKRSLSIRSPRNCGLSWFKTGIVLPLQFTDNNEAVTIMGHLFGKDAAQYTIKTGKYSWDMSIGITVNTKSELEKLVSCWK